MRYVLEVTTVENAKLITSVSQLAALRVYMKLTLSEVYLLFKDDCLVAIMNSGG